MFGSIPPKDIVEEGLLIIDDGGWTFMNVGLIVLDSIGKGKMSGGAIDFKHAMFIDDLKIGVMAWLFGVEVDI